MLHASDLAVLGGKQPVLSRASSGCMCYTAGAIQRPQFMLYIMTPAFTRWVFALYLFCHDLRDSCEPAGADLLLPEHVGHNRSPQGIEEPSRPCALQQPCGSVANGLVYASSVGNAWSRKISMLLETSPSSGNMVLQPAQGCVNMLHGFMVARR